MDANCGTTKELGLVEKTKELLTTTHALKMFIIEELKVPPSDSNAEELPEPIRNPLEDIKYNLQDIHMIINDIKEILKTDCFNKL